MPTATRVAERTILYRKKDLNTHWRPHGGVLAKGGIRQEAIINLVALRTLTRDWPTRRYLLGLALVALSYRDQEGFNLREGCLLCAKSKEDLDGVWKTVSFDGTEDECRFKSATHEEALEFAQEAAKSMAIAQPAEYIFDKETAGKWLGMDRKKRKILAKTKHPTTAIADDDAAAAKKKEKESAGTGPGEAKTQ